MTRATIASTCAMRARPGLGAASSIARVASTGFDLGEGRIVPLLSGYSASLRRTGWKISLNELRALAVSPRKLRGPRSRDAPLTRQGGNLSCKICNRLQIRIKQRRRWVKQRRKIAMAGKFATTLLATAFALVAPTIAAAEDLEVLHYWTSGGESKAVNVLKQEIEKKGHTWVDSAIAGGGGQNAMTVLKARAVAGDPPAVVQMRGPAVQDWASQGMLAELDSIAGSWPNELPPAVLEVLKYDGHIYAAPHWIHRVNWNWINKKILDEVGGKVPTTWDEYFDVADKMKAAGYTAIAYGNTPYENGVFFEGVVQSMGVDFYRKAILEANEDELKSDTMVKVFDIMRRAQQYFDDGTQGRAWNLNAAMVIEGKAGMFFMGDWAKGEFSAAGKVPGVDYICAVRPGTEGIFTFIADTFVFFKQHGADASDGQLALASLIESPEYQQQAAKFKGSIPALNTASLDGFDECALKSAADMKAASESGGLVPAQNQGTTEAVLGAIRDVVVKFMNSDQDSKSAAEDLARAVTAAAS